jgi:hypothetical protein
VGNAISGVSRTKVGTAEQGAVTVEVFGANCPSPNGVELMIAGQCGVLQAPVSTAAGASQPVNVRVPGSRHDGPGDRRAVACPRSSAEAQTKTFPVVFTAPLRVTRVLDGSGLAMVHGQRTHASAPGLCFIGYINAVSGMFREIRHQRTGDRPALRAYLATSAPSTTAATSERNSS